MPQKDFGASVFKADANAASDWGSIGAGGAVDFKATAELKRGFDLDLGLMAMANVDASFSRFLTADLQGTAQAQASVRAQIQLPMNLFDELGAAVRLQAIAELAAGVRLGVGLALGDFLALAAGDGRTDGVPLRLLRVFLEETELELGFFAKAALSAQAYANVVVTGTVIASSGAKPGFTIAAGAGAGLKAGAGFQVFGTAGVQSFGRLVARSADILVDDTVQRLAHALPDSSAAARGVLFGARPLLKIALRLSFELGEQFAAQSLAHDAAGQQALSARGLQVVLEELQRAVCEGLTRAATQALETLLAPVRAVQQAWDGCHAERYALADKLDNAPAPLASADSIDYWLDLMGSAAALALKVGNAAPGLTDNVAMGWAALKLAARVGERVARASAGVSVLNNPPRQVAAAFAGPMSGTVPGPIDGAIRAALASAGQSVTGALQYEHLVVYLAQKPAVDALAQANPGLAAFLDDVRGTLAPDLAGLVRVILDNASTFAIGSAPPDPTTALTEVASGLQGFAARRLTAALRTELEPAFAGNDDLRTYFDEVLLPTLDFALAVTLQEALAWATSGRSAKAVTEALSAILLKLLGRSLVSVVDTVTAHVQVQMRDLLLKAASIAGRPNGLVAMLASNPAIGLAASDIAELVSDALTVGADVFGPLPDERRARIRALLYDVLDPAGGAPPDQLVQALEDPGLIPNEASLRALAQELGELATERFVLFVQGLVTRIMQHMADAWIASLSAAIAVAEQFLADLAHAIGLIVDRLSEIGHDIQVLAGQVADAVAGALGDLDAMLDAFSSTSGRTHFVDQLAASVSSNALGALEHDWAYTHLVPSSVRHGVRQAVRGAVADLLHAGPFEAFLGAIGALRDQVDEVVDDARSLDRNAPLAPQVADLVLARLAALVADRYGDVHVRIAFGFHWNTPLGRVDHDFDLGTVKVHVGDVADIVRPVARNLGAFESAVDALAARLQAIFDGEAATADLRTEQDAVSTEHARLSAIAAERQAGPKSVIVERPVQMQATTADTLAAIRLEGFSTAIVTVDEHTPQRLFVLLNGQPVALDSFRIETVVAPAALRIGADPPVGVDLRHGAIVASAQRQSRVAAYAAVAGPTGTRAAAVPRATLGSRVQVPRTLGRTGAAPSSSPAGTVRISGHLPLGLLVPGLNTLTVAAVTGPGERVSDTVAFVLVPASDAMPSARPPRGRKGIPDAAVPAKGSAGLMLPSARKTAARTLAQHLKPVPVAPLAKIAAHSPSLAQRAGIVGVPLLPRPGTLRPAPRTIRKVKP